MLNPQPTPPTPGAPNLLNSRQRQQQLPRARPAPQPANRFVQHTSPRERLFDPVPYTPEEFARIQSKLNEVLGKEYVSDRPAGGGQTVKYIEGWKALNLANEIFGFNGWNTEIITCNVDYFDPHDGATKFSLGLSMVVRVTLRDGTFHEDIGYGYVDNCKSKAMAFEKCKKEALTDGVKRCLRCFGNLLGNCLYDKSYLAQLAKIKKTVIQYQPEDYHHDPLLVERERKKKLIDEKFEQMKRAEEEAAKVGQQTEEQEMRARYGVADAQPRQQQQPPVQQQRNGIPQGQPAQRQPVPQQAAAPQQPQQQTRVNPQNQVNGHNQQQRQPQPRVQPTNQQQQQQQQQQPPPTVPPQPQRHPATFVTPVLPNKHIDYVPTSKEADELDDSFLFSDDVPGEESQHGHHHHHLSPPRQQPEQHAPAVDNPPSGGGAAPVEEPLPKNALNAFVSAKKATLLQEESTDPSNVPIFDPTFISPNIRRTVDPKKSVKTRRNDSPSPLGVNVSNHMISKPYHNPIPQHMGKRVGMPPQPRQNRRPHLEASPQPPPQHNIVYPPPAGVPANAYPQPEAPSTNQ
ncbi:DNA repair and recombination protein RAD52 [Candida viswanathii]|uniref:DNA repair and recombination protein RAD52 n=1 Tax=Candida viswanathii TaxID=5486 RepID=A0A367XWX3_9ASCO|nr:DNA repair and recombination protein RAD52 [Candida viswanathii]